ncbi:helix-turn-helix domain-containing protein [Limosilactobacillus gastricus]|uniref:helix-turn-helix domain-containing protein n=1 Tax=Limosilactobacillus gastricus TaxID=227942 RepID=UPI00058DBC61|nr:helix-turn-helix transcriptional regulator [Limosilactobacillus gastricus]
MGWTNVQKIISKRKITIAELARLSRVNENTLRNYKKGHEPTFGNMVKIADALGVSLDDFR